MMVNVGGEYLDANGKLWRVTASDQRDLWFFAEPIDQAVTVPVVVGRDGKCVAGGSAFDLVREAMTVSEWAGVRHGLELARRARLAKERRKRSLEASRDITQFKTRLQFGA